MPCPIPNAAQERIIFLRFTKTLPKLLEGHKAFCSIKITAFNGADIMKKRRSHKQTPPAPFCRQDGAAAGERRVNFACVLENGMIFAALLIAVIAALYILNGQLIRLI